MSKKVEKFIVIEDKGMFLASYGNRERGGLFCESHWVSNISQALMTPIECVEGDINEWIKIKKLAEFLEANLLVVELEYSFSDTKGKSVVIEPSFEFFIEGAVDDED